jgi:hypothetical protein
MVGREGAEERRYFFSFAASVFGASLPLSSFAGGAAVGSGPWIDDLQHLDGHAGRDLDLGGALVQIGDLADEAGLRDHAVTDLEAVLQILLLLRLVAGHEDHEQQRQREDEQHARAAEPAARGRGVGSGRSLCGRLAGIGVAGLTARRR